MSINGKILQETLDRASKENGGVTNLGMSFYKRLFEKYPQVKPLFKTPPEEQHKKLIASIGAIVAGVKNLDTLVPYLRAMGIRHLKYKTENAHYAAVGENLVAVLGAHLSKEGQWTDEMKTAWEDALKVVSDVMIEGANNPEKYKDELAKAGYEADGFKLNSSSPWVMN